MERAEYSLVPSRLKTAESEPKPYLFQRSLSMTNQSTSNYHDDVLAPPRISCGDIAPPRMSCVELGPARKSSADIHAPPRISCGDIAPPRMSCVELGPARKSSADIHAPPRMSFSNYEQQTHISGRRSSYSSEIERSERGETYTDIKFRCASENHKNGGHIFSLAAADGILYTGSECNIIRSWKATGENLVESERLHSSSGMVRAILLTEDKLFSAHADHKIRVWRCSGSSSGAGHKRLATIPTLLDSIHRWIKPKRDVLGCGSGRRENPKSVKHMDAICCLAYNDGFLYSGSSDKTVKVWRVSDLKCVETIQAHDDAVNAIAVGPDGLIFTGSDDCAVKIWRKNLGSSPHVLLTTLHGKSKNKHSSSPVKALALNSNGSSLYTGSSNGEIIWWEKERYSSSQMRQAGVLRGHVRAVLCLETVGGNFNLLFSGSVDATICVWSRGMLDSDTHTCSAVIRAHGGPVKCIAASYEEENRVLLFSGSLDGSVKMWRIGVKHRRSRPAALYH